MISFARHRCDNWKRLAADFDNYRKRAAAQSLAEADRASGRLAEALLPVLDAAEAAYVRHPDEVGPLLNQMLGLLPEVAGSAISLQRLLGWLMAPLMWLIGIPWAEATTAGALMGTKTVLNEFLAYLDLAAMPADALGERSRLIVIYAMCGFANFGSLGIMIGGLGAMAPSRRAEIVALGMKSILAGTLATCMTGAVVALITF